MIDFLGWTVLVFCMWAILCKHLPTGILGSFGLALIGMAAGVAVDDNPFTNVTRLEGCVTALLMGFMLVVAHVTLMVWRGTTGKATRRRRTTDWQAFDAEDTRPMERA